MDISEIGKHVVVLDDDAVMSSIIEDSIEIKTFRVGSLTKIREYASKFDPLAVFVDVHLDNQESGLDGISFIKEQWPESVIIVITADSNVEIIGKALSLGADDFVRKPIVPEELRARLCARLDAATRINEKFLLKFGDCQFNTQTKVLQSSKGKTQLSSRESALLEKLVNARGMVVSKDELRAAGWGDFKVSNNALDRKLHELRKIVSSLTDTIEIKAKYGDGIYLRDENFSEQKSMAADYEIINAITP